MKTLSVKKTQIKLYGGIEQTYYYLKAYIGQPPQLKNLIFDTGSKMIVFMCKGCTKCSNFHMTKPFNFEISSTFQKLQNDFQYFNWQCKHKECKFTQKYSEGSLYKGFLALDSFKFEQELEQNIYKVQIFGCGIEETDLFLKQKVDGIIGFGVSENIQNSQLKYPPGILKLQQKNNLDKPINFSFCLSHNGGYVSLQGWNKKLHLNNNIIEIKNDNKKWTKQYNLTIVKIKLDNEDINYNFQPVKQNLMQNAFLDTGTTFVHFIHQLFLEFQESFDKFCQKNKKNCSGYFKYQPCYQASTKEFLYHTFPVLKFYFNKQNIELNWLPQDYIIFHKSTNQYCISIKPLDRIVLGATFMINYDIQINNQQNKVSFIRSNCSKKLN